MRGLEIQIRTYSEMIKSHPNWIFAGVFYDIESGLRRSGRKILDKLLRRVAKGKIDYIITKSISRVSRDTLKILKIIRFLRERGINMHFENEKLVLTHSPSMVGECGHASLPFSILVAQR